MKRWIGSRRNPRLGGATASTAPLLEDMRTIYAVGDIHGCYRLLIDLLAQIAADADALDAGEAPLLVFLGDYVDRGPATPDVLASLIWMQRHSPLDPLFLLGNHERMMLDYLDDPVAGRGWLQVGGAETLLAYGVALPGDLGAAGAHEQLRDELVDRLPASHLDFLRGLRLYAEIGRHVFVHAGIRRGIDMAAQNPADLLWIRGGFLDDDRREGPIVVHGHSWMSDEPVETANRIGVDTGAYETGVLTAVRLQRGSAAFFQARDIAPRIPVAAA